MIATFSFVTFSLASILTLLAGHNFGNVELPYTMALAFAIPGFIGLIILLVGDQDNFSPLHIVLYLVIWGCALKTVYFLYLDTDNMGLFLSTGQWDLDLLFGGLVLVAVGLTAYIFGYLITFPYSRLDPKPTSATSDQLRKLIFILIPISVIAAFAIYQYLSQTNSFNQILSGQIFVKRFSETSTGQQVPSSLTYLRLVGQVIPQIGFLLLLALLWIRPDLKKRRYYVLLAVLGILSCAIPLLASSRLTLIYFLVSVVLLYHYLIRSIAVRKMAFLAFIGLVLLGVLGELRKSQSSYFAAETDFSFVQIISTTLGRPYFLDIGKTSAVHNSVPDEVDFIRGASLTNLIYAPIPRSLWPEKPVLAINIFVRDYILQRDDQSGVPPGGISELFLNFGYTSVVFGMIFFGILVGLNYKSLRRRSGQSIFVVFNILLTNVLIFTFLTVEIVTVVSQSAQLAIPMVFIWMTLRIFGTNRPDDLSQLMIAK